VSEGTEKNEQDVQKRIDALEARIVDLEEALDLSAHVEVIQELNMAVEVVSELLDMTKELAEAFVSTMADTSDNMKEEFKLLEKMAGVRKELDKYVRPEVEREEGRDS